jgi:2-haloacid dehalogenase
MFNRREFVTLAAGAMAVGGPSGQAFADNIKPIKFKAVAFDGFPIIDPRPVFARLEEMFPAYGPELGNAWRSRQFEYTWLRTLGGRYVDFWQVTEESLIFAAKARGVNLSATERDQLMQTFAESLGRCCAGVAAVEERRHSHGVPVQPHRNHAGCRGKEFRT